MRKVISFLMIMNSFLGKPNIPTKLSEPNGDSSVAMEEKSELNEWFDEKVMPFIVTSLGGLTGTGVVSALIALFLSKSKKLSSKAVEEAKNALKLEQEEVKAMKEQMNHLFDLLAKDTKNYLDSILAESIQKLNISVEEINKSKVRQEGIANKIMEVIEPIICEEKTNEDNE